jgi:hypothetical protein
MTERNILAAALKIIGIVVIAQVISSLPTTVIGLGQLWSMSSGAMRFMSFLGVVLTSGLIIYIAYFFLKKSDLIAESLINPDRKFTISISSGWEKSGFILALRIIGVILVIKLAPNLVNTIIMCLFMANQLQSFLVKSLFGGIFQLLIGLYLISGGAHIVDFAFKPKTLDKSK